MSYLNFSNEEHTENLKRLDISCYSELVHRTVYYCKKSYGLHRILAWDSEKCEYLLELDGNKFWSNPFRIKLK